MKNTLEVIEIKDQEDGGAIISFDMDEEVVNLFVRQGIRKTLEEMGEKYFVVQPDEWKEWSELNSVPEPRKIEMSSFELQGFFQIGVLEAIMIGIDDAMQKHGDGKQLSFDFDVDRTDEVIENGC